MSNCTIKYEDSDLDHKSDINLDYDPDYKSHVLSNDSRTADAPMDRKLSPSFASVHLPVDHTFDNDDSMDIKDEPLRIKIELETHVEEIWYECDICHKQFIRKNKLLSHIRYSHNKKKLDTCNICHTKPYECNICQKRLTSKQILTNHMRTHTGEKPYECHICRKRFINGNTLKRHMRTHTGEKPYECNICQKRFTTKEVLSDHIRTHTGQKPYECNICQKRLTTKLILSNHMRTHTGEKPYECNICQKRFINGNRLNRHMRTHKGQKPLKHLPWGIA